MKLPPLFNPWNDMALAANVRQYFPPQRIQQMEHDLQGLARLWAEGPWGWSLATRQRYRQMGVADDLLPTDAWLAEVRRLSGRAFAVDYYRRLTDILGGREAGLLPCRARFVTDVATLSADDGGQPRILKAPWSSSGRGNILLYGRPDEATLRRIGGIVREQGGIVAEPFYGPKAVDFAMEFHVGDSGARFLGYSVFQADAAGHYGGNYVESQAQLRQRIGADPSLLQRLADYHREALSRLPYRGPVGIDMMRLGDGSVHPCVELNFRMTMGLLALILHDSGTTDDCLLAGRPGQGFCAQVSGGRLTISFRA